MDKRTFVIMCSFDIKKQLSYFQEADVVRMCIKTIIFALFVNIVLCIGLISAARCLGYYEEFPLLHKIYFIIQFKYNLCCLNRKFKI